MKLKDFLTKKQLKTFIEEHERNVKVKRINLKSDSTIVYCKSLNGFIHCPRYGFIMSAHLKSDGYLHYDIVIRDKEYKYIMDEVNFFRQHPEDAKQMEFTLL
jgi:hypothetical protein